MKFLVSLSILLVSSSVFAAGSFECRSKYFNGNEVSVGVVGQMASATQAANVVAKLDGKVLAGGKTIAADLKYNPTSANYKDFNRFVMPNVNGGSDVVYVALLLPKTLSQAKFTAFLQVRGPEGGSTNRLFCRIN